MTEEASGGLERNLSAAEYEGFSLSQNVGNVNVNREASCLLGDIYELSPLQKQKHTA